MKKTKILILICIFILLGTFILSGCKEQDNSNSNGNENIEVPDDNKNNNTDDNRHSGTIYDYPRYVPRYSWISIDKNEYNIDDNIEITFKFGGLKNPYDYKDLLTKDIGFCVAIKENDNTNLKNKKDELGDILYESDELYFKDKYSKDSGKYLYIDICNVEKYFTNIEGFLQISVYYKRFLSGEFVYKNIDYCRVYYKIENDKVFLKKWR